MSSLNQLKELSLSNIGLWENKSELLCLNCQEVITVNIIYVKGWNESLNYFCPNCNVKIANKHCFSIEEVHQEIEVGN